MPGRSISPRIPATTRVSATAFSAKQSAIQAGYGLTQAPVSEHSALPVSATAGATSNSPAFAPAGQSGAVIASNGQRQAS